MTWHAIETAPRDGTWVLLGWHISSNSGENVVVGYWNETFGYWDTGFEDGQVPPPEYWMPIEKLPK